MKIFKLPDLGEGLQEAEIVRWHVTVGDTIAQDAPLVSVETAKAIVDIPSPYAGKIQRLFGGEHDVAHVGQPLVGFEGGDDDAGSVVGKVEVGKGIVADAPPAATPLAHGIKATPSVRALARRLNVDLAMVTPTGAEGLITTNDVQRAARILAELGPQELLRGVRKVMAQSMTLAHAEVASATLMDDADIHAWHLGENVMLRLIRALVAACRAEPSLNAWYDSQAVGRRLMPNIDVGIAVDRAYKGKGLQMEFTVDDPAVFTTPWKATITYRRGATEWREHVCAENMHEYYNSKDVDVPTAVKPDF